MMRRRHVDQFSWLLSSLITAIVSIDKIKFTSGWSDYALTTNRVAPRNAGRCYTVCPPPVFANGPDPFYQSAFAIYDLEHPNVFERPSNRQDGELPGRLQQVAGDVVNPVAGFW